MATGYKPLNVGSLPSSLFAPERVDSAQVIQERQKIEDNELILQEKERKQRLRDEMSIILQEEKANSPDGNLSLEAARPRLVDTLLTHGEIDKALELSKQGLSQALKETKEKIALTKQLQDITDAGRGDWVNTVAPQFGIPGNFRPKPKKEKSNKSQKLAQFYNPRSGETEWLDMNNPATLPRLQAEQLIQVKTPEDVKIAQLMLGSGPIAMEDTPSGGMMENFGRMLAGAAGAQAQPAPTPTPARKVPPPGAKVKEIRMR